MNTYAEKRIVKEENEILYGINHTKLTLENGEVVLKSYDEESKMWVYITFKDKTNEEINITIDDLVNLSSKAFF